MKVKCGTIYNAIGIINELAEKPMKISLTAKFLRLADDLQKENNYIEKQRNNIFLEYGLKDDNGELIIEEGSIKFASENITIVQKQLEELSEVEVDIPDRNITEEELENNNIELSIKHLLVLREFFHKEEENIEIIE